MQDEWLSRISDGTIGVDEVVDGNKSVDWMLTGWEQVLEVGVKGLGGWSGFQDCCQVDL
jgi:hypothetical protein